MGQADFTDIEITGVDRERTLANSINGAIYRVHLKLSIPAPHDWCRLFAEEWKFPRHSMWRKAHATSQYIIIECPIDEIEQHHKQSLKEVVQDVNRKYKEYLAQSRARAMQMKQKADEEDRQAKEALDKIKF